MALKDLAVVTGEHSEEGVLVEFWVEEMRCIAVIGRTALDDTFDKMLPYGERQRRLTVPQWNGVVQENITAFERIIESRYARDAAAADKPIDRVDVSLEDISRAGESWKTEKLRAAGIARPRP